ERSRLRTHALDAHQAMTEAADAMEFEVAARERDQWGRFDRLQRGADARISRLRKQQFGLQQAASEIYVVQPGLPDVDVWGLVRQTNAYGLAVLPFRGGRLGRAMHAAGAETDLSAALLKYYRQCPPPCVLLFPGPAGSETDGAAGESSAPPAIVDDEAGAPSLMLG